jgi:hypothetical protein
MQNSTCDYQHIVMKKYWKQIFSWVIAVIGFYVVSWISINLLLPLFGYGFPQKDGIGRLVQNIIIGIIILICYLSINYTAIGQRALNWFVDANKNIFKNKKAG